jgi:hypothetical protein
MYATGWHKERSYLKDGEMNGFMDLNETHISYVEHT